MRLIKKSLGAVVALSLSVLLLGCGMLDTSPQDPSQGSLKKIPDSQGINLTRLVRGQPAPPAEQAPTIDDAEYQEYLQWKAWQEFKRYQEWKRQQEQQGTE